MPGLDPKAAVHCLAVKRGVRPIKQAQRRFRPELIPQIESEVNKLIRVHPRGKIPNMDREHCPCQKEEQTDSHLC